MRLPWPDNAHEGFFPELQHVGFFKPTRGSEEEIEFTPGNDEFRDKVREAGQTIKSLLLEMRRGLEAVFIASSTDETMKHAGELRRELRAQAYDVRPRRPSLRVFRRPDRKGNATAVLTVHVLGASYDPFVEKLIDLAANLEKPLP